MAAVDGGRSTTAMTATIWPESTTKFYFENNGAFWKSVWKGIEDDITVVVNTTGATGGWGTIAILRVVVGR